MSQAPSRGWFAGYDGAAVVWASLVTTLVAFLSSWIWLPVTLGGNGWVYLRMSAATVLGREQLAPPAAFSPAVLGASILALLVGAALLTLVVTLVLHRWGFFVGLLGGAAMGIAAHLILVRSASYFFPWLAGLDVGAALFATAICGAVAGGVYELLDERDEGWGRDAAA